MHSLAANAAFEDRAIPAWVRERGLDRCFMYYGSSMVPTFRPGQLLYVRPDARDILPGDVVVFEMPDGYAVHRVVAIRQAGLLTRGDNNLTDDRFPVAPERLVGRVELRDEGTRIRAVRGGWWGLWLARSRWAARWLDVRLRRAFLPLYGALRRSPVVRRTLGRLFGRRLRVLWLRGPEGAPLVKVTHLGYTVARWWPETGEFECRKPYDLFLSAESLRALLPPAGETPPAPGVAPAELPSEL